MNKEELHYRLQEAMDKKGLRAVDLVEKTGIPKGTLSYYLAGKTKPKNDRLYILAQALDVSEAWLLGYDVPMARSAESKKNDVLSQLVVRLRRDEDFYNTVVALAALDEKQYRGISDLVAALNK